MLRRGDVLVVWRLDRLGRSLPHLIELLTELEQAGIGFQSVFRDGSERAGCHHRASRPRARPPFDDIVRGLE